MKFIFSFLIVSSILSADTSFNLNLANLALTPSVLCAPAPTTPVSTVQPVLTQCPLPTVTAPTQPTINCDQVPTVTTVVKCTPAPVICQPKPVIECPTTPVIPVNCHPGTPSSATPEPASYALVGAGLMTAGIARKFRSKKNAA